MSATPAPIDPRGPRFGAAITSVVLATTLLLGPAATATLVLLGLQAVVFGLGALVGLAAQPYGIVFKRLVRPRLAPPTDLEDPRPPRFAQSVGFGFALVGLLALVVHLPALFYVAVGFALVAAVLNAVFDFCLGCEVYLLVRRLAGRPLAAAGRVDA